MEVTFQATMTRKAMYDFLMNHTYKSPAGILRAVFGAAVLALLGVTWKSAESWQIMLYGGFGFLYLLYPPINLYLRSAAQVKTNPIYKNPITYTLSQEGVATAQGENRTKVSWTDIVKVRETGKSLLLYTGKSSCAVLPRESMGEKYSQVREVIRENMEPRKVKLKETR